MLDWQMELLTLVSNYGAAVAADLAYMSEREQYGLYLYLLRKTGADHGQGC